MNFVEKKRKESMITIPEDGEHGHKLLKIIARSQLERVRLSGKEG